MLNEEIKVTENGGKTVTVLTLEDCEKYHGLKRCGSGSLLPCYEIRVRQTCAGGRSRQKKINHFQNCVRWSGYYRLC